MNSENAKDKTSSIRRGEDDRTEGQANSNSESGAPTASATNGLISVGIARASGEGAILGGILTRMIAEKRSRIRETEECLEWYKREKVQRETELAELEQLAAQMQSAD